MSKFLVETYYTCTFKILHEIDELNEKVLSDIDNRNDGKVEIIDVTVNNRKTKKAGDNKNAKKVEIQNKTRIDHKPNYKGIGTIGENLKENLKYKELSKTKVLGKRFQMPDRRKGYIQKLRLEIIKFTYILANMMMEKLVKYLLILIKRVNWLNL